MAAAATASAAAAAATRRSSLRGMPPPPSPSPSPSPLTPAPAPAPAAPANPPTIYDAYPLTLRAYLTEGPPPLERSLSQQRAPVDDTSAAARRLQELFEPPMPSTPDSSYRGENGATYQRVRAERRSSSMCSRFGKFHGEVYETKERSRVMSVLKRRTRSSSNHGSSTSAMATRFTADDVLRCGTLLKQGSWRRNWKSRFFILRKDCPSLCYYKSEENLELLGSIVVTEDTLVLDRCAPGGHAPYRFLVRSGEHSLLLQAEARDGQQRWIDSVQALADSVRADKFRQSTRHVVDRDPTTASLAQRSQAQTSIQLQASASATASAPVAIPAPKTPQRRRRRADQRSSDNQLSHMASSRSLRSASDLDRLLEANSLSSSDEEEDEEEEEHDNQRDHEDDDDEDDDEEEEEEEDEDDDVAVALQDDDDDVWASHRSHGTVIEAHASATDATTTRRRPSRVEQLSSSTPLPTTVSASASSSCVFDLVLEVSIGRASKLLRSIDDRTACLVRVAAFSSTRKSLVEIGCTDAVLLAPLASAASAAATVRVPFAVVLTAELGRDVDQLRVALYKVSGHSQSCVGVGRVAMDAAVRHGQPTVTSLTEKSSSFQTIKVDAASSASSNTVAPTLGAMGSVPNLSLDSSALQVVVTAFHSLSPQRVLPTSGVDMANAKYLVAVGADAATQSHSRSLSHSHSQHTIGPETSLSVTSPTSASASEWQQLRASDARGLGIDNSSFLTVSSELGTAPAPADVRRLAVDEILRVPRSSFALVLAFLDFLEESALERTRELQRRLDDGADHDDDDHASALLSVELEFYRRKLEEYLRQRQFLMKQERRLLDEHLCDDVARHAREQVQLALNQSGGGGKPQSAAKRLRRIATGASASSLAVNDDVVAPFKRSTYKSLELWQFMPTNMQNQFLVAHQPTTASDDRSNNQSSSSSSSAPSFVWHTMTMGCPAAHTKGFTSGGYLSLAGVPERTTSTAGGATSAAGASSISGHEVRHSNPASASSEEDSAPSLDYSDLASSSYPRQTLHQQQQQQRRSRTSLSSSTPVFRGSASGSSASGMGGAVDDPVAALKTRLELQDRLDIVSSQILSAAVACIQASLDLATLGSPRHRLQLANATKFGFLVHFESLLSTQGKEIGMLEDFAAGAKWLGHHVVVQFRKHRSSGELFVIKPYTAPERRAVAGGTGLDGAYSSALSHVDPASAASSSSSAAFPSLPTLLVTIGVSDAQLATLPPALASGKPFRLRCVLFTQGVNEKQSLAHALKSAAVRLQERINRENLEELRELYAIFRRVHAHDLDCVSRDRISRQHSDGAGANCISRYRVETLDELLATIEHHVLSAATTHKKNVALLMDTADFCRELGGARVTCCKSGKDRTAMSVTLEQARLCGNELHALHGQRLCATMRRHGVRRRNVFLNTKSTKFAFNEMQRRLLPDCYKPPAGTYKSGKT
ncbi:hypothetical protein PINS_up012004 [Pythium insidiosum]|nr:hypothetical protein PINS_up012004 [Pythium insidiosum]